MVVSIEIPETEAQRLQAEAERLGVSPQELARAAVLDLLNRNEDFTAAASYVLAKNRELYQRLS